MKSIVCYGDSNTWGFAPDLQTRYPKDVRWPGLLQKRLGEGYDVIEEGLNARTTCYDDPIYPDRNGVKNLKICMLTNMPVDLVIIMLGTNDTKKHLASSAYASARGIEMMVQEIRSGGYGKAGEPKIIIISPIVLGEGISEVWTSSEFDSLSCAMSRDLAKELKLVAEQTGCAFLDAALIAEPDPLDACHLNVEGHALLADAVYKKLLDLL